MFRRNNGRWFILGSFLKATEVAHIFMHFFVSSDYALISTKNVLVNTFLRKLIWSPWILALVKQEPILRA
jgi:hypothetical protein